MKRTVAVLTLLLTSALAGACGGADEPRAVERQPAAVSVAHVAQRPIAERLEAGGVVVPADTAIVSSRLLAAVLEVRVRAGDAVRQGDVLVTLDARESADRTRQAKAAVAAAEQALLMARSAQAAADAEHQLATSWHARISALHGRKSATAQELDEATARLAAAEAQVAGARAAIDLAEANLTGARAAAGAASTTESFTVVRAPFDGLVTERLIDPGNLAAPATPLLRLESAGVRRVEITVDEARVAFIQPGDRVEVLIDRGGEGELPIDGTVTEIARTIAVDRRAFTVTVAVPAARAIRTGTFARVRFRGATRTALVVPAAAVRRHGQVASVFVVEENTARLRLVQIGEETPDGVIVLAGVDQGETVVISAPADVPDGRPVVVGPAVSPGGAHQ